MKRLFTAGLIWLGALGYANSQNWKQAQTGVLGTGASHQFGINIGGAWSALFTITGAGGVIPGGLAAFSCASNTWLASSSGGGAVCTQPAFSDISGVASANQIPAPTTSTSFRNRLTNANFDIWQRGTSFTVPTGSLAYTADRWFAQNDSGGNATVTQASAPAGFRGLNAIRIQAPMSAGSIAGWGQRFEGQMVRDLDGKNVVVSFDLSQSVSGGATTTWYLQLFGNTALDNGTFSTTLFSTTFTPPASAGVVSIAIPAASTVGLKYGAHFMVVAVRTSGSGTLDAYLGSV